MKQMWNIKISKRFKTSLAMFFLGFSILVFSFIGTSNELSMLGTLVILYCVVDYFDDKNKEEHIAANGTA